MGKQKKKPSDNLIRLALITAIISLMEKLIVLVTKLLELMGGG